MSASGQYFRIEGCFMNFINRIRCLYRAIQINSAIHKHPDTFDAGYKDTLVRQIKEMQESPVGTIELQGLNYLVLSAVHQAEGRMDLVADAAIKGLHILEDSNLETKTGTAYRCLLSYMAAYGAVLSQDVSKMLPDEKSAIRDLMYRAKKLAPNDKTSAMVLGGIAMTEFLMNDFPDRVAPAMLESVKLAGTEQLAKERGEGFGKRLKAVIPESWKQYTQLFEILSQRNTYDERCDTQSIS
jgi:hypothetical protein